MTRRAIAVDSEIWKVYPTGRITVYGKDEFGLLFELGTGPERKRRFTAIRLWDPRVPTHLSLSSLSSSCWTSSANRSPRGRRPRADTAHSERSASWTRPRVSLSQPAECFAEVCRTSVVEIPKLSSSTTAGAAARGGSPASRALHHRPRRQTESHRSLATRCDR